MVDAAYGVDTMRQPRMSRLNVMLTKSSLVVLSFQHRLRTAGVGWFLCAALKHKLIFYGSIDWQK